jgi:hypothetical protein
MTEAECFCKKVLEALSEAEDFVFIKRILHHFWRRFHWPLKLQTMAGLIIEKFGCGFAAL